MILIWNGIWYRSLKNYVTSNELHCNFSSQIRVFCFCSRKKVRLSITNAKLTSHCAHPEPLLLIVLGSTRGMVLIFGAVAVDISLPWAHPSIMASVPHGASSGVCEYINTSPSLSSYPCNEHPFPCNWKGNFPYPLLWLQGKLCAWFCLYL